MAAPYDVTDAEIQGLIKTSFSTDIFAAVAATFVSESLVASDLSNDRLHQITLYFAAHLACLSEENGGLRRSRLGESDESFKAPGDKDVGLASTRFGQACMMLDSTGTLASATTNNGLKAKFEIASATYDCPIRPPWFL